MTARSTDTIAPETIINHAVRAIYRSDSNRLETVLQDYPANLRSKASHTLLRAAVCHPSMACLETLLEAGFTPNHDPVSSTPADATAAYYDNLEALKLFEQYGWDKTQPIRQRGRDHNPLALAAAYASPKTTEFLAKALQETPHDAKPATGSPSFFIAITEAIKNRNTDVIPTILDHTPKPDRYRLEIENLTTQCLMHGLPEALRPIVQKGKPEDALLVPCVHKAVKTIGNQSTIEDRNRQLENLDILIDGARNRRHLLSCADMDTSSLDMAIVHRVPEVLDRYEQIAGSFADGTDKTQEFADDLVVADDSYMLEDLLNRGIDADLLFGYMEVNDPPPNREMREAIQRYRETRYQPSNTDVGNETDAPSMRPGVF